MPTAPRVFLLNGQFLQQNKRQLLNPGEAGTLRPALVKLESDAQKALGIPALSITAKTALPPSGDKHDYLSQAPYWWPNPDKPTGLPYIRRDGETNPEIKQIPDHAVLDQMINAVITLAAAYYFTGKEAYAAKAAEILRGWFLDPKTKMNPNLEFAQAIPGVNTGRGIGIIETRNLPYVIDAIGLLNGSRPWGAADQAGIQSWFVKFLAWLTESPNGRDESDEKNNHGTFYDVQVVAYSLFTGKTEAAKKALESAKKIRIVEQLEPDGRQPLELARTKSWNYSNMNLEGLLMLAALGESAGVDLWNYKAADGRSIRRAIDFLFPFALNPKTWTYKQIETFTPERLFASVRVAARSYRDAAFAKMMSSLPALPSDDRAQLLGH
ncbi:MAG: alginate lyase family protein [Pyrinomonadaceae bacterium]